VVTVSPVKLDVSNLQRDVREVLAWRDYQENTSRYAGTPYYDLWEPACWRTLKAKLKEAGISYGKGGE
jgi:hypothetical protein